jgi:hypothetical protein
VRWRIQPRHGEIGHGNGAFERTGPSAVVFKRLALFLHLIEEKPNPVENPTCEKSCF